MYLQATSPRIPFVTPVMSAYEGFLTSMSKFMSLQVSFCNKLLFALGANKRSLTGMSSHVGL